MKEIRLILWGLLFSFIMIACEKERPIEFGAVKNPETLPTEFDSINYNIPKEYKVENIKAVRALGYFGLIQPASNASTCNNCHITNKAGLAHEISAIGLNGELDEVIHRLDSTHRLDRQRVPIGSYINIAFRPNVLSTGAAGMQGINQDIDNQFLRDFNNVSTIKTLDGTQTQPFKAEGAHDSKPLAEEMSRIPFYQKLTKKAFGVDSLTNDVLNMAIAVAEKSFITSQAPYQKYLRGEIKTLGYVQNRGLDVFLESCEGCHSGKTFGGVKRMATWRKNATKGLFDVTKDSSHLYHFMIPQLYNNIDRASKFNDQVKMSTWAAVTDHPFQKLSYFDSYAVSQFIDKGLYDPECGVRTKNEILEECEELISKEGLTDIKKLFNF